MGTEPEQDRHTDGQNRGGHGLPGESAHVRSHALLAALADEADKRASNYWQPHDTDTRSTTLGELQKRLAAENRWWRDRLLEAANK